MKHSTSSNLLESTRDWSIALNSKKTVDIAYIDYRLAFDSVVHSKLLAKLQSFGIADNLLAWLAAFLSNRTQRVCIENCLSSIITVTSGIIQGSVLGPILFILYVNDLSDFMDPPNVKLILFADDLKLYSSLDLNCTPHTVSLALQSAIDHICDWSRKWQLTINASKCNFLRLGPRPLSSAPQLYSIEGNVMHFDNETRDLGLTIDNKLSYINHITSIVNKAMQRTGMLFKGFVIRDPIFLRKAFITYVRPLVEYCTIIWNPTLKKYIDLLENVQRKFTKRIPSIQSTSYLERLEFLKLESLELRRLHFDLIYYYKILHNLTPHDPNVFFTFHNPPASVRCASPILVRPTKGSTLYFSSFSYRSINAYNFLPNELKEINSLPAFIKRLKQIDLTSFLNGSCYTDLSNFNFVQ